MCFTVNNCVLAALCFLIAVGVAYIIFACRLGQFFHAFAR